MYKPTAIMKQKNNTIKHVADNKSTAAICTYQTTDQVLHLKLYLLIKVVEFFFQRNKKKGRAVSIILACVYNLVTSFRSCSYLSIIYLSMYPITYLVLFSLGVLLRGRHHLHQVHLLLHMHSLHLS